MYVLKTGRKSAPATPAPDTLPIHFKHDDGTLTRPSLFSGRRTPQSGGLTLQMPRRMLSRMHNAWQQTLAARARPEWTLYLLGQHLARALSSGVSTGTALLSGASTFAGQVGPGLVPVAVAKILKAQGLPVDEESMHEAAVWTSRAALGLMLVGAIDMPLTTVAVVALMAVRHGAMGPNFAAQLRRFANAGQPGEAQAVQVSRGMAKFLAAHWDRLLDFGAQVAGFEAGRRADQAMGTYQWVTQPKLTAKTLRDTQLLQSTTRKLSDAPPEDTFFDAHDVTAVAPARVPTLDGSAEPASDPIVGDEIFPNNVSHGEFPSRQANANITYDTSIDGVFFCDTRVQDDPALVSVSVADMSNEALANYTRAVLPRIDHNQIVHHYKINHSDPDEFFNGHRRYLSCVQTFLNKVGVQLPLWDPKDPVPELLQGVKKSDVQCDLAPDCDDGWYDAGMLVVDPQLPLPYALQPENICTLPTLDKLHQVAQPYHDSVHVKVGGAFSTFDSPGYGLFYAWHNYVDQKIYKVWQDCWKGILGPATPPAPPAVTGPVQK